MKNKDQLFTHIDMGACRNTQTGFAMGADADENSKLRTKP